MNVLLLNGPNLKTLGKREPEIYGTMTYQELNALLNETAFEKGLMLKIFQSNHEGKLIDLIEEHTESSDALIINPGAYTHTSIALMDAVKTYNKPTIEVHLSNPMEREDFRHVSYIGLVAEKTFAGSGVGSYILAIEYLVDNYVKPKKSLK